MNFFDQIGAMAFYHEDGFVAAHKNATRFTGKNGRLATLPDIINARLATDPGETPWEMYFTSLSAEYFGVGKSGKRIIIVAHGIGPMSTLDGILNAYRYEFGDKERNHRGGRISQQEFWDLEAGLYGDVEIVDFEEYVKRYQYPFMQILDANQAIDDPLLRARLGPRAVEYVLKHEEYARQWHQEQLQVTPENEYNLPNHDRYVLRRKVAHSLFTNLFSPSIITLEDASNCTYGGWYDGVFESWLDKRDAPFGHLLSIGQLVHTRYEGKESVTSTISCHEWWDGTRLVAVHDDRELVSIHPGPNVSELIRKHWQEVMVPVRRHIDPGFRVLIQIGDKWFTQYPKKGARLDTYEPEFLAAECKPIGEPVQFTTTIGGYYGFFKYGINEIRAVQPAAANAYALAGEPEIVSENGNARFHTVLVQFYQVNIDTTQRLRRADELSNDFDTLIRLVAMDM
jgi:hypothetical protein